MFCFVFHFNVSHTLDVMTIHFGSSRNNKICQCKEEIQMLRKICLGTNFRRLVPFELQKALSHVLHKPQVNKLGLTADYASGEKMLEVGVLFHNRPKQWEY